MKSPPKLTIVMNTLLVTTQTLHMLIILFIILVVSIKKHNSENSLSKAIKPSITFAVMDSLETVSNGSTSAAQRVCPDVLSGSTTIVNKQQSELSYPGVKCTSGPALNLVVALDWTRWTFDISYA